MARETVAWFDPQVSSMAQGVLYTLSYADVYDYPLTLAQIHRYLVGFEASPDEIAALIDDTPWARRHLTKMGAYYMLAGREGLASLRRHRAGIALQMWPRALHYASIIARVPFVRMVALTGALPMDNVESGDDYDYLIVTERNHLWLARFFIVQLIVKPAMRRKEEICPNYLITERALAIEEDEQDLYRAHEVAQMVPLYGQALYTRLRAANAWADRFLPNAAGPNHLHVFGETGSEPRRPRRLSEPMLNIVAGAWFERRERARLTCKLNPEGAQSEVALTPDCCKGHVGAHGERARLAFEARIAAWDT